MIWASGSEGNVLRSLDEGKSWEIHQSPHEEMNDFRSIHAWSEKKAMAFRITGPVFCYLTEDGGQFGNKTYIPVSGQYKE